VCEHVSSCICKRGPTHLPAQVIGLVVGQLINFPTKAHRKEIEGRRVAWENEWALARKAVDFVSSFFTRKITYAHASTILYASSSAGCIYFTLSANYRFALLIPLSLLLKLLAEEKTAKF
jgi:hypothetical protein